MPGSWLTADADHSDENWGHGRRVFCSLDVSEPHDRVGDAGVARTQEIAPRGTRSRPGGHRRVLGFVQTGSDDKPAEAGVPGLWLRTNRGSRPVPSLGHAAPIALVAKPLSGRRSGRSRVADGVVWLGMLGLRVTPSVR
jgi:hypothetical protein